MNISPETERLQNALAELASAMIKIINDRVDQTLSGGNGIGDGAENDRRSACPPRTGVGLVELTADNQLVGKEEIAEMLGMTIRTVDNWMDRGLLPYFKIGRSVRFRKNDVLQHLNQCARVCRR
jgi:excisionase family DNA binding protein